MKMPPLLLVCCTFAGAAQAQDACLPPAVKVDVSGHFINTFVERPVQRKEPVHDWILDNEVHGTGYTFARVFLHLQPDPRRALLAIVLQGTAVVDSVGYYFPCEAYTRTWVDFDIRQPISIDECGLHLHPLLSASKGKVCLYGMANYQGDQGANSIAFGRYQFYEDKIQVEQVSASKVERKTKDTFARDVRPQFEKLGKEMGKALGVLSQFGLPLEPLHFSTSATHLHAEAGVARTSPPELPLSADLTLRVHQSALQRMAQQSLPGKTLGAMDLLRLKDQIATLLDSNAKPSGAADLEKLLRAFKLEPATITFSRMTPIAIDMNADGLTITLSGSSFHQAGVDYPARQIRARYRIQEKPGEIAFVRQGSVEIIAQQVLPDEARERNLKLLLEMSFNLFLPDRLALPKINIPGEKPMVLEPTQAMTARGWLGLSWTRGDRIGK